MTTWIRNFLESCGIYIKPYRNNPGIDWGLDVARALHRQRCETLFDVGANVGQTVEYLSRRFPDAMIHAFEPVGSTFQDLVGAVGRWPRVQCHHLALSDSVGSKQIAVLPRSELSSLEPSAVKDHQSVRYEEVPIDTVDGFCRANDIRRVDVLKTDTEGHDLHVLAGAEGLLAAGAIRAVYCEVTFSTEDPRHTLFFPVYDYLTNRGFRLMGLYELHYFQSLPQDRAFCNALFSLASELG